jgi:hypothetical protein
MTIFSKISELERLIQKYTHRFCCLQDTISTSPFGVKFGVSGADDIATETREFILDGNGFSIADTPGYDTYFDINSDWIDLYIENGNEYAELYMQSNSFGIYLGDNSYIETDGITQNDTADDILALDGSNRVVYIDKATILQEAAQDDTATKIAAIDGSGNTVWVDKATITAAPAGLPTYVRVTEPFFSSGLGSGGAGGVFYNITGLTYEVPANTRAEIEVMLYMFDNSSNFVEDYLLQADQFVAQGQITYELLGPIGAVPSVQMRGGDSFDADGDFLGAVTYNEADWTVTGSRWRVRVTAHFTTGGTATNFTMQAGTFSGVGAFQVMAESYMKITTF